MSTAEISFFIAVGKVVADRVNFIISCHETSQMKGMKYYDKNSTKKQSCMKLIPLVVAIIFYNKSVIVLQN